MSGAIPGYAATWVVDAANPELECPNADFSSIQEAVTAAAPGDKIEVCPGLYNESVTVPKTLELQGAGPDPKRRTGDPTEEAVVTGPTARVATSWSETR